MRKLFLLVSVLTVLSGYCISPREAFVTAPRSVITAIDSLTRLDMLDYYTSGSTVASRNAFGGDVSVKLLTDESISIGTTISSDVTISVLPAGRDTMFLVVNTLALPTPDSYAVVYKNDWTKGQKKLQPVNHNDLALWVTPQARARMSEIENFVPFVPAIYTYSDGVLTITNTLGRLLSADDYNAVKPYLKPAISYRWNGKKWSMVK